MSSEFDKSLTAEQQDAVDVAALHDGLLNPLHIPDDSMDISQSISPSSFAR
jgi:hypothetical protein